MPARRERDGRAAARMYAIAHALDGVSRAEAARLAGRERQALRDAVGRVCHRWWRRGERPPGLQQLGYLWAYIFTAIRPATGEDVTLVLPTVNTAAMQVFLDHVAASRPADVHLVLVLDGAGWHVSRDLVVPPSVTLVVLPPYCPELNLVERVWLYLRDRFLSLRLLSSTDAIIDACCAPGCASLPRRVIRMISLSILARPSTV